MWLKPKKEAPVQPVSEQERSRLESLLRKKALEDMAAYFYEATATVAPHVVRLEELSMLGGGVFNLDGNLAAVIVSCQDRPAALAVEQVETLLKQRDAPEARLFQRYGMKTGSLEEWSRRRFAAREGLLVTEVWDRYPPAAGGLRPGDIILAVEEDPVRSQEELESLLSA